MYNQKVRGQLAISMREVKYILVGSEKINFWWMGREEILRRK